MARTAQLDLPLLMPAQAQKHVTVNEALARLDAIAQLRIVSSTILDPPVSVADGASYLIPSGAAGSWQGQQGNIAVWSNGGWIFVRPKVGWRAWDEGRAGHVSFDGTNWIGDAVSFAIGGAGTRQRVIAFDHPIVPGASNTTSAAIPDRALVIGVTGRVVAAITGSGLSGWRLGVAGSEDRYGSGLGTEMNSFVLGLSGSPVAYYGDTPMLITAEGGSFVSGTIRLAFHVMELTPPRAV